MSIGLCRCVFEKWVGGFEWTWENALGGGSTSEPLVVGCVGLHCAPTPPQEGEVQKAVPRLQERFIAIQVCLCPTSLL